MWNKELNWIEWNWQVDHYYSDVLAGRVDKNKITIRYWTRLSRMLRILQIYPLRPNDLHNSSDSSHPTQPHAIIVLLFIQNISKFLTMINRCFCTFHSYPMIFPAYVRRLCWLLSPWTRPSFQVRPAVCHEKTFYE